MTKRKKKSFVFRTWKTEQLSMLCQGGMSINKHVPAQHTGPGMQLHLVSWLGEVCLQGSCSGESQTLSLKGGRQLLEQQGEGTGGGGGAGWRKEKGTPTSHGRKMKTERGAHLPSSDLTHWDAESSPKGFPQRHANEMTAGSPGIRLIPRPAVTFPKTFSGYFSI